MDQEPKLFERVPKKLHAKALLTFQQRTKAQARSWGQIHSDTYNALYYSINAVFETDDESWPKH